MVEEPLTCGRLGGTEAVLLVLELTSQALADAGLSGHDALLKLVPLLELLLLVLQLGQRIL